MPDLSEILRQLTPGDLQVDAQGRIVINNPNVVTQIKDAAAALKPSQGLSPVGFLDNKCGTNTRCAGSILEDLGEITRLQGGGG